MSAFEVSIKRAVQIHCYLMAAVSLRVYNDALIRGESTIMRRFVYFHYFGAGRKWKSVARNKAIPFRRN